MSCPCECNRGGFCGGCGHAGCSGGINLRRRERRVSHTFANGVRCYDPAPIIWANSEDCLHEDVREGART